MCGRQTRSNTDVIDSHHEQRYLDSAARQHWQLKWSGNGTHLAILTPVMPISVSMR